MATRVTRPEWLKSCYIILYALMLTFFHSSFTLIRRWLQAVIATEGMRFEPRAVDCSLGRRYGRLGGSSSSGCFSASPRGGMLAVLKRFSKTSLSLSVACFENKPASP